MATSRRAISGNRPSAVVFGLTAVLLIFAPPTARPGRAAQAIPDFRFCSGYLRSAPPRPARRRESRSRSMSQPAALRISPRRIARVRSFSVRRLPTCPGAICRVLASHRDRVKSGRAISSDRTFRRRSPTGIRPCQRPSHRRRSARRASMSEISMRNALA